MSFEKYEEPDVWECPKCGAPNRPGNGRCWSCGTKEEPAQPSAVEVADLHKQERQGNHA